MAAPKVNKGGSEHVREKIRLTQLLNRLQDNALGDEVLSPSQVRSIEILLRKVVPDLSATKLEGDEDNPIQHKLSVSWQPSSK